MVPILRIDHAVVWLWVLQMCRSFDRCQKFHSSLLEIWPSRNDVDVFPLKMAMFISELLVIYQRVTEPMFSVLRLDSDVEIKAMRLFETPQQTRHPASGRRDVVVA